MVTLAAICNDTKSIFKAEPGFRFASDHIRTRWKCRGSDHLALLTAWDYFMRVREMLAGNKAHMLRQWCEDHFLDMDVLERIVMSRWRLVKQLRSDQHFKWPSLNLRLTTSQFPRVLKALATAFCTNLAVVRRREDIYLTVYAGVEAMVEPHSAAIQSHSEWVVYNTLQRAGGRVLLEVVSPVSAEWLVVRSKIFIPVILHAALF